MTGYYSYVRPDKREAYVNNSIYEVYAVCGMVTTAHWTIRAGSWLLALKYVEQHPEKYRILLGEHLEVAPKYIPETVHLPFEV